MNTEDRERLVNATLHFANAFANCTVKRLFVALYVLDVLHFQRTGRSVTTLDYFAGGFGPYPNSLAQELEGYLRPDLAAAVSVEHVPGMARNDVVRPLVGHASLADLFSPIELRLFSSVAELVDGHSDLKHVAAQVDNGASAKALVQGKHRPIVLDDAVAGNAPNRTAVLQKAAEHRGRAARLRSLAA